MLNAARTIETKKWLRSWVSFCELAIFLPDPFHWSQQECYGRRRFCRLWDCTPFVAQWVPWQIWTAANQLLICLNALLSLCSWEGYATLKRVCPLECIGNQSLSAGNQTVNTVTGAVAARSGALNRGAGADSTWTESISPNGQVHPALNPLFTVASWLLWGGTMPFPKWVYPECCEWTLYSVYKSSAHPLTCRP